MSSVIAKQPKDTKKQTTVSLSGSVLADLEHYCQFIDSARDWVINEALKTVFHRDKAFLLWKQQNAGKDGQSANEQIPPCPAQVELPLHANPRHERGKTHRSSGTELPPAA